MIRQRTTLCGNERSESNKLQCSFIFCAIWNGWKPFKMLSRTCFLLFNWCIASYHKYDRIRAQVSGFRFHLTMFCRMRRCLNEIYYSTTAPRAQHGTAYVDIDGIASERAGERRENLFTHGRLAGTCHVQMYWFRTQILKYPFSMNSPNIQYLNENVTSDRAPNTFIKLPAKMSHLYLH